MSQKNYNVFEDLVHFSRIALEGNEKQTGAYVRRLIRKMKGEHPDIAEALEKVLSNNKPKEAQTIARRRDISPSSPIDGESRLELLSAFEPDGTTPQPILHADLQEKFERIVRERGLRTELRNAGLEPTKSILMVGPPGVGKTLTAHWLASRLQMPLYVLNLASVMSSYLGRTGANIRNVMHYFQQNPGILFLDEFDAVAKKRSDESDIGELRRLVTVILQELDNWPSENLLLAATNHSELLDPAIWRRFDYIIDLPLPSYEQKRAKAKQVFDGIVDDELISAYSALFQKSSFSDIERDSKSILRRSIVENKDAQPLVLECISEKVADLSKTEAKEIAKILSNYGLSQRRVSTLTGLSRDTIRSAVNEEIKYG